VSGDVDLGRPARVADGDEGRLPVQGLEKSRERCRGARALEGDVESTAPAGELTAAFVAVLSNGACRNRQLYGVRFTMTKSSSGPSAARTASTSELINRHRAVKQTAVCIWSVSPLAHQLWHTVTRFLESQPTGARTRCLGGDLEVAVVQDVHSVRSC
jgi:hypothetical protein